jgi:hypothetical protein
MKKAFFIAVSISLFGSCLFSSKKSKDFENNFKKIVIGMSKEEVISIVGNPEYIQKDTSDNYHYYEHMYYADRSLIKLNSNVPTVVLDSNRKVTLVISP